VPAAAGQVGRRSGEHYMTESDGRDRHRWADQPQ
jgi:hypothetical protein